MKKIDIAAVPMEYGSNYPSPFNEPCRAARGQRLARYAGLTKVGVNLTVIDPGAWSSQRHWHSHEEELVWVLEGELISVTEDGEETLRAGDCVAFRCANPDGHHLINRSGQPAKILEIGHTDPEDACTYSDIDMVAGPGDPEFRHKDGTPYD